MQVTEPSTRRWTIEEYYQMADLGFFEGQRVELIDGEIIELAPQRNTHAAAVSLTSKAMSRCFGDGYWVRAQFPLHLGDASEPEPDVAVVPGTERDYPGEQNPTSALLLVEVSDTTLRYDRGRKASFYASVGIADYWIVNLVDRQLEVHREPVADAAEPFGFRYRQSLILKPGERVSPLARPGAEVAVAEMLP